LPDLAKLKKNNVLIQFLQKLIHNTGLKKNANILAKIFSKLKHRSLLLFVLDWKLVIVLLGVLLLSLQWVEGVEGPGPINDLPMFESYEPEKKHNVPILLGERSKLAHLRKMKKMRQLQHHDPDLARICLHIGATGLCFEHRPLEPILRS
jgi:hypothetical protein